MTIPEAVMLYGQIVLQMLLFLSVMEGIDLCMVGIEKRRGPVAITKLMLLGYKVEKSEYADDMWVVYVGNNCISASKNPNRCAIFACKELGIKI